MARKGNTALLKKIHAEAKRIQKAHPKMTYKEALKDAGKHIREGAKTVVKKDNTAKKATKKRIVTRSIKISGIGEIDFSSTIKDLDSLKKEYKRLAKIYHPDAGGTNEQFKQLQSKYESKLKEILSGSKMSSDQVDNEIKIDENLRAAIDALIGFPGIDIEVVGKWVWVSGNTYPIRKELTAAGFKWAPNKKMWYYAGIESGGKGSMTMEEIRAKYGSEKFTPGRSKDLLNGVDIKIPLSNKRKLGAALKRLTKAINKRPK